MFKETDELKSTVYLLSPSPASEHL